MSNQVNFHPIIVRDERIQSITTDLPMVMKKTGAQNTYSTQNATSKANTGIQFNVTAPSEGVVLDRHVKISNKVRIKVAIPANQAIAQNAVCFSYGQTEALSAFPFNSLINTATVTINSATSSVNTQDIFGTLSKMYDQKDFDEYHCPTMLDQKFKKYSDMQLSQSNPLGNFTDSKSDIVPRGAHALESMIIARSGTGAVTTTEASTDAERLAALTRTNPDQSWVITMVFETVEPLLFASPLIYGKSNNNAGLYGITKLELQLNLDTTAKRVLCSSTGINMTVSLDDILDSKLLLNYLTPQTTDLIAPSNVVPYTEYQRYITSGTAPVAAGDTASPSSNSVQFNSIPSKIYVVARKKMNLMTCKDSDSFLPIESVSIQFNNLAGIFSSASAHDLYIMSKKNGFKQSAYEFYGSAAILSGVKRATTGSVLVLDPVDFGLPEYLTSGSTGNMNFQINAKVKNTDNVPVDFELMVLIQNDGIFQTQNGMSMKQTALFTKKMVADATMEQYGEPADYVRSQTQGPSMTNVQLLNAVKSGGAYSGGAAVKSGGAYSGGGPIGNAMGSTGADYTRRALNRFHSGI